MATRRAGTASTTATAARCPSCGAGLIRQPGEVIPVTVDATPIPTGTDPQIRGPNRLTWCAPPARSGGPPRLLWVYPGGHPPDCPHPHHADHQCTTRPAPAAAPQPADTLF
ncbi:hypothetical protein V2S66_31570 [Streptomyces sp. V4-01]|uniref:Uncharacterized protein n=1 Tax=Actinacidiphila polyblastidii TaxID=3110430 RepID=A0ABU7PMM9_9ACTN|nr:hypothetical protein [Streptomyces sp. V4-01]